MSKLPNTYASIFSIMSQWTNEHQAINLSQGFPNFPEDKHLTEIVARLSTKNVHQYTPMAGLPNLLEKITKQTFSQYKRSVVPSTEMLITAGATQAIFTTISALITTQDEVLILDPSYDSYEPSVLVAGGTPVRVALQTDYAPDFNAIEKAITPKTKMIVINNPHNPTGKVWSENDFLNLETLLEKHPEILILADEVYEYITFLQPHISFHTRPKLMDRTVVVSSFGKSLHVTGWKIGYAIAPEYLMREIKKVHQFLVFSVNSVAQFAIAEYLDFVDFSEISRMYEQKKNHFQNLIKDSRFQLLPCEGTYFQVVDYSAISKINDVDFAKELVTKHGVAAIPISVFYQNSSSLHRLRFCFAKTEETLEAAAEKLCQI